MIMVQRFTPEIKVQYHKYEEIPDRYVEMNQSRDGEWIKFDTYRDVVAQLQAQLQRLRSPK